MSLQVFQPNFSVPSEQFLIQGVVLDASVTTVQNILQLVPNPATSTQSFSSTTVAVVAFKFRNFGHAVNAATTFGIGWSNTSAGTSSTILSASTALQSAAAGLYSVTPIQGAPLGLPNQYLTVTFGGTLTSNTSVVVDVIGYFTPAS